MLRFYGSTNRLSPNTLKIRAALAEVDAPYEYVPVDLAKKEQLDPAFLAINPHGKIPALVDGAFKLAESNAILFYVAELFPRANLLPTDPQGRARALQFCDFTSMSLYTPYYELYTHTIYNPPAERNAGIADKARANLERSLAVLETVLGEREYLAGVFSVADLAVAATLRTIAERLPQYAAFAPRTQGLYDRVAARPAWQHVVAG